jgi:uncharacterized membrane protein YebE (DUF533 family)
MDLNKMVQGLMSSGIGGGLAGGLASGLLVNAVGKKKVGKVAGSALKLGGAAVVGGLAWKAYENYRAKTATGEPAAAGTRATPANTGRAPGDALQAEWQQLGPTTFMPADPKLLERRDLLILRAMITAAHADGHVDREERSRIFQRIEMLDLGAEEKSTLFDEILVPRSLKDIAAEANEPALAAEIYMASLLMVDPAEINSRIFLSDLADQLRLPGELVLAMHEEARQTVTPGGQPLLTAGNQGISPLA